jgi:hypothetical protein
VEAGAVRAAVSADPTGGDEEMLLEMRGEGAQNGVRVALGIHGAGETPVEPPDGHRDGADAAGGVVARAPGAFAEKIGDGAEVAPGRGFDSGRLIRIFRDGLQFGLAGAKVAHGADVLGAEGLLDQESI